MGTLTINGRKITVDDSFAKLSPADQEKTVNEIAAQMGAQQDAGPPGAPGSREYADWAAAQARAGKALPQVSPPPPGQVRQAPGLYDSALATVNGLTGAVPGLQQASDAMIAGGQTVGDILANRPGSLSQHYGEIQQQRQRTAAKAPLANTLGGIGGTMALTGGLGSIPAGAEALGMTGGVGKQLLNSALSTAGYEGLQSFVKGKTGRDVLADEAIGAGSGLIGSTMGQGLNKLGGKIADSLTSRAQNKLTNDAIQNAPSAADLFSAGSQLFDKSTGGNPLQVTDNAYFRLLGDVQQATKKYRPNDLNNPEAVGLLQQLWQVGDELSAGTGVAVDFKDLHILRQSAQAVTQKPGASDQTKSIARLVVKSIDGFINGLKPGDIAGGADPKEAANALLTGISTWAKASKVSMIEQAIQNADTYKSGTEMGLKNAFTALMKTPEYQGNMFTPVEKQAIREVAKGTSLQNAMALLGRAGFSLGGGGGHNIIGGTFGAMTGSAALTPFLGPLAPAASLGLSMGGAAAGRAAADKIATQNAARVARIMATSGIPMARQVPNLLARPSGPAGLLVRAGIPALAGR